MDETPAENNNGFSLDDASMQQLEAIASALDSAPQAQEDAPTLPPEHESELITEEITEEETQQSPEPTPAKVGDRVRLTGMSETDKALVAAAVQMVKGGLAANIADAMAAILPKPQEAAYEQPEDTEEAAAQPSQIEALQAQITALKADIKKAAEDYDKDAELELQDQLIDAKADLKLLQYIASQQQQTQQAEAQTEFQSDYADSVAMAGKMFDGCRDPNSPLYAEIKKVMSEKEASNPAFFDSPDYPLAIASIAAARIGKTPAAQKQQSAPQSQPPRQTPRQAQNPLVGGTATRGVASGANIDAMLARIDINNLDELAQAVFRK